MLGPGSDPYHAEHIHVDLAERAHGYRMCQWNVGDAQPVAEVPIPLPKPTAVKFAEGRLSKRPAKMAMPGEAAFAIGQEVKAASFVRSDARSREKAATPTAKRPTTAAIRHPFAVVLRVPLALRALENTCGGAVT